MRSTCDRCGAPAGGSFMAAGVFCSVRCADKPQGSVYMVQVYTAGAHRFLGLNPMLLRLVGRYKWEPRAQAVRGSVAAEVLKRRALGLNWEQVRRESLDRQDNPRGMAYRVDIAAELAAEGGGA